MRGRGCFSLPGYVSVGVGSGGHCFVLTRPGCTELDGGLSPPQEAPQAWECEARRPTSSVLPGVGSGLRLASAERGLTWGTGAGGGRLSSSEL